jgi:hypothetical protein
VLAGLCFLVIKLISLIVLSLFYPLLLLILAVKATIILQLCRNLQVKGPSGDQIHDFRDKTSEKFDFVAHHKGLHRFCSTNKSPYHETIDFDIHVSHFTYYDPHAKDGEPFFNILSPFWFFSIPLNYEFGLTGFVHTCRAF